MKKDEIEAAVHAFREHQLVAANNRINATAARQQEPEMIDREMAGVDARVAGFRESLGQPDDAPVDEPQADESPVSAVVLPGVKTA